jgi:hypothetical protein
MSPEKKSEIQESEKDYSEYISFISNQKSTYSFICGFTFTTITLLIMNLPNPNSVLSQLIVLFLTIVFDLLLYLIVLMGVESLQFCRNVPAYRRRMQFCDALSNVGFSLWGFSIPSMFLLWNFISLALVSTIIWIIVLIISYFTARKHFKEYRKITKVKRDTE